MSSPAPTAVFPPATANGTTIIYQPLPTSFSAPQPCSTYYLGDEFADGNTTTLYDLTAWSPWYEVYGNRSAACLPEAVVSSETEFESRFSASLSSLLITTSTTATARTTTVFAPFSCFDEWHVVYSSVVSDNSSVAASVCCPTQYNAQINTIGLGDYNGVDVMTTTVQCVSTLWPTSDGSSTSTLTYDSLVVDTSDSSALTSPVTQSTILDATMAVTAVAYTGYNLATNTASSSLPSPTDDTSSNSSSSSSGLSTGAKAGIGDGVAAGVVLIAMALVFWIVRRRRQRKLGAGPENELLPGAKEFPDMDGQGSGALASDKTGLKAGGPVEMQADEPAAGVQELHNGVDRPELMGSGQAFAQELEGSYEWPVQELEGGTTPVVQELDAQGPIQQVHEDPVGTERKE
ncbi:hypothetical protein BDW66DRAFT_151126 [Aspergillus desertorum]